MTLLLSPRDGQMKLRMKLTTKSSQKKATPNHNGSCRPEIYPPPCPIRSRSRTEVGENKVIFTISKNKLPLFIMRCFFWNIRGIANEQSQIRLSKLIKKWDPDIVGIAKPKIHPKDIPISFLHTLGMSTVFFSNPGTDPNRVPNIWLIWKSSRPNLT
ncbi:hypothetical protein IFM89_000472 [Coptis chinensis]|uniref:Uncharacterized protein n=1 Tax=Coptis chinensis TaxID=261450 RepID=A0A835H376_9MAGN|nr:hypothetical protein IFM89_000472 [Coptis chinensis]